MTNLPRSFSRIEALARAIDARAESALARGLSGARPMAAVREYATIHGWLGNRWLSSGDGWTPRLRIGMACAAMRRLESLAGRVAS
jgi:hypothetical protein